MRWSPQPSAGTFPPPRWSSWKYKRRLGIPKMRSQDNSSPQARPPSRLRRSLGFLLYNVASVLALCLIFEGAASTYYAFRTAFAEPPVAESLYTQYDPELGWVSLPNVYHPNMYGPGKFLKTNSQRFRNTVDFMKT